jgi:2-aminoadipate transaminase
MYIPVDRKSHVPVHVQVEESIRGLIGQGRLRPGSRLPSMRQLAVTLGINRMTVGAAFKKLEADGLIVSHVGRGSFVSRDNRPIAPVVQEENSDPRALAGLWGPRLNDLRAVPPSLPTMSLRRASRMISFTSAAPGPDLFPTVEFRRSVDYVIKRRLHEITNLGPSDGLPSLKAFLARWLAQKGISASEDEILVTTGCQQAMDLIRRVLVAPGDAVMLENPTYPGAIAALTYGAGDRLELPVHASGPDLGSLGAPNRCKLAYVVPNFHNPTGKTMPREARERLVAAASRMCIPLIEDDVFGDLHYDGPVLPSLKTLCPHLVIYIGSFSKSLNPGLRVGWVVAPRPVIRQLCAAKQASDLQTNLLMQVTLDEFCRRDLLYRHLKRAKRIFRKRRDAMAEAIKRWFPSDATWTAPDGGLSIWVSLSPQSNTDELLRLAQEQGVQFLPSSVFHFRSPAYNSLRLSFAVEDEQRIVEGVRLLGSLLKSERLRPYYVGEWAENRLASPIL